MLNFFYLDLEYDLNIVLFLESLNYVKSFFWRIFIIGDNGSYSDSFILFKCLLYFPLYERTGEKISMFLTFNWPNYYYVGDYTKYFLLSWLVFYTSRLLYTVSSFSSERSVISLWYALSPRIVAIFDFFTFIVFPLRPRVSSGPMLLKLEYLLSMNLKNVYSVPKASC